MTIGSSKADLVQVNVCLRDLDKDYLLRKMKEIKKIDAVHYKRTCSVFEWPKVISKTCDDDFSDFDDSADAIQEKAYKPGTLGYVRVRKKKLFINKRLRKPFHHNREFKDLQSAIILSDAGHLNKFQLSYKNKTYVFQSVLQDKRRFYVH